MTIDVIFLDSGREPQCKLDPNYPKGKPMSLLEHAAQKSCCWNLPWPAPRCGVYQIKCRKCGFTAAITVAGRSDDPNMITMPCARGGLDG